ncbi:hypothetical protein GGI20_000414 [Coemansia sp. BCRC 34301]|nr:hypothetical protein GGI20_000414 [Coemansia sp. BCRC 34301]
MDKTFTLADVDTDARIDEERAADAQPDAGIARLLQTIKDANALVSTAAAEATATLPPAANDSNISSSDLDTSSSDSDMEEDEEEDSRSTMLRMIADGGDDDEEEEEGSQALGVPTTRNEVLDPQIPEPTMTELPATAPLTSLGTIHSIVDNSVIIQAHISGERHVLDAESILSFDDRKVLGLVYDVFGPVSRPMYTVRFKGGEVHPQAVVGRGVFFSPGWVKMLATEKLRVRGTDASNEYDEEVGEDAMEFSDDEEERVHRKNVKKNRHQSTQNRMNVAGTPAAPSVNAQDSNPPPAPASAPALQNARKLQSYQDLYDADLGF